MRAALLTIVCLSGCSVLRPPVTCANDEQVLARSGESSLTCAQVGVVHNFGELLAGRRMGRNSKNKLNSELVSQFSSDSQAVLQALVSVQTDVQRLSTESGLQAARSRSHATWQTFNGGGPLAGERWTETRRLIRTTVLPWATSDEDQLVLVEEDIEGFIRYASLCREVQGGGTLQLSIASREVVYTDVMGRFNEGPTQDRVGLVAYGAFWIGIAGNWKSASYVQQQAWIQRATLPPPMTASSLGYAEAVLQMPPGESAKTLHHILGPIKLDERAR
ncbi:MAG: hypothetical protein ACI9MC_000003 [Kiritimatiellia bacterium]|jgi:hypothetical protein